MWPLHRTIAMVREWMVISIAVILVFQLMYSVSAAAGQMAGALTSKTHGGRGGDGLSVASNGAERKVEPYDEGKKVWRPVSCLSSNVLLMNAEYGKMLLATVPCDSLYMGFLDKDVAIQDGSISSLANVSLALRYSRQDSGTGFLVHRWTHQITSLMHQMFSSFWQQLTWRKKQPRTLLASSARSVSVMHAGVETTRRLLTNKLRFVQHRPNVDLVFSVEPVGHRHDKWSDAALILRLLEQETNSSNGRDGYDWILWMNNGLLVLDLDLDLLLNQYDEEPHDLIVVGKEDEVYSNSEGKLNVTALSSKMMLLRTSPWTVELLQTVLDLGDNDWERRTYEIVSSHVDGIGQMLNFDAVLLHLLNADSKEPYRWRSRVKIVEYPGRMSRPFLEKWQEAEAMGLMPRDEEGTLPQMLSTPIADFSRCQFFDGDLGGSVGHYERCVATLCGLYDFFMR